MEKSEQPLEEKIEFAYKHICELLDKEIELQKTAFFDRYNLTTPDPYGMCVQFYKRLPKKVAGPVLSLLIFIKYRGDLSAINQVKDVQDPYGWFIRNRLP